MATKDINSCDIPKKGSANTGAPHGTSLVSELQAAFTGSPETKLAVIVTVWKPLVHSVTECCNLQSKIVLSGGRGRGSRPILSNLH